MSLLPSCLCVLVLSFVLFPSTLANAAKRSSPDAALSTLDFPASRAIRNLVFFHNFYYHIIIELRVHCDIYKSSYNIS
jgi:hypothetical protein